MSSLANLRIQFNLQLYKVRLHLDAIRFVNDVLADPAEHVVIRYIHRWPNMSNLEWQELVSERLSDNPTIEKHAFHPPDYLDTWTFGAYKKEAHHGHESKGTAV